MPDEKLGPPAPVVLAMVLCDAIYQDPATQKCTLLGTFSTITGRKFPMVHQQLSVHIALTDGRGKTRIRLMLVGTDEQQTPLFNQEGTIEFNDPRTVAELNFVLRRLSFPRPGEYRVQVYGNDQLLGERRLFVMGIRTKQPPNPPTPDSPPSE